MTGVRNGFSLAHRAALMVAGARRALITAACAAIVATLAVVGVSHAGPPDPIAVTNSNFPLFGSISVFTAGGPKNKAPATTISGGIIAPAFPVSASEIPGGIAVSPLGALYITNDISLLGTAKAPIPDVVSVFAPNATGTSGPIAAIIASKVAPLSLPQGIAFNLTKTAARGEFYVSNLTGGGTTKANALGSVILFPADAGTSTNPLGTPIGVIPNLVTCEEEGQKAPATALLLPVGVATDANGNLYVANSGVKATATSAAVPSYVTEYAAGKTGCISPINLIGLGTIGSANGVAVDPRSGNVWVSDLTDDAILEFSPQPLGKGTLLTKIAGKKTQLTSPMGIALSPAGLAAGRDDVYVANNLRGTILLFENVNNGGELNIKPLQVLNGKKTKINLPVGIAPL